MWYLFQVLRCPFWHWFRWWRVKVIILRSTFTILIFESRSQLFYKRHGQQFGARQSRRRSQPQTNQVRILCQAGCCCKSYCIFFFFFNASSFVFVIILFIVMGEAEMTVTNSTAIRANRQELIKIPLWLTIGVLVTVVVVSVWVFQIAFIIHSQLWCGSCVPRSSLGLLVETSCLQHSTVMSVAILHSPVDWTIFLLICLLLITAVMFVVSCVHFYNVLTQIWMKKNPVLF